MIRQMREDDISAIRSMEGEFKWNMGDDFMECLVYVDDHDVPRLSIGAWRMAEVHATFNSEWSTPSVRMEAFRALHEAMEHRLQERRVGRVVTWFDSGDSVAFLRRLKSLLWVKCNMDAWVRKVGI